MLKKAKKRYKINNNNKKKKKKKNEKIFNFAILSLHCL